MSGGGLEGRVHLQEGVREEVGDVGAGRRRGRRSAREGSRRRSSEGRLKELLGG